MGLLSALSIGQSSLSAISTQTSIASQNIAGASLPGYTRKYANLTTSIGGQVNVASVAQATNASLQSQSLDATANLASINGLQTGYTNLEQLLGSTTSGSYLPTLLTNFQGALQTNATNPSDTTLANATLDSAKTLVQGLNDASSGIQAVRTQADSSIATSVTNINSLLQQYQTVDTNIVKATASGADATDMVDQRNQILSSLSQEIGTRSVEQNNGSLSLYTTSGIVLYDGSARSVTFNPPTSLDASTVGSPVYIDGVDATSANSPMPISGGSLSAAITLRDTVAPKLQAQVDEVARGLINSFAESDQSATPTAPTAPGLFTWSGAPGLPGNPAPSGLAYDIKVNPAADPSQGGNLALIRDGGLADPTNPNYNYNTTGGASFSTRLQAMASALDASQSFNPSVGLISQGSVNQFANSLVASFEGDRQNVSNQASNQQVINDRTQQALSDATGVNLDTEMANMLDLENSYQATAKLMSTVNTMMQSLLQVVN